MLGNPGKVGISRPTQRRTQIRDPGLVPRPARAERALQKDINSGMWLPSGNINWIHKKNISSFIIWFIFALNGMKIKTIMAGGMESFRDYRDVRIFFFIFICVGDFDSGKYALGRIRSINQFWISKFYKDSYYILIQIKLFLRKSVTKLIWNWIWKS